MKKILIILSILIFSSCNTEAPTEFTPKALNETFKSLNNTELTLQEILDKYKGKKILIDIWASWCGDCIRGLPKLKTLQKNNPEVVFLFLSLDKTIGAWKNGIDKYRVKGEHYFIQSGDDGDFGSFANINWIPRYMIINEQGNIVLFKSVKADDTKITEILKK